MSYSFGMYFKQCDNKQAMETAINISKEFLNFDEEIILKNSYCMPSIVNNKLNNEADEYWLYSLFTYNFVYWPEQNILGVSGYDFPKEISKLFDCHVCFQNSTDQDYSFNTWSDSIILFKNLKEKYIRANVFDLLNIQSELNLNYTEEELNSDIDYYRKSFMYKNVMIELNLDGWLYNREGSNFFPFALCSLDSMHKFLQTKFRLRIVRAKAIEEEARSMAELIVNSVKINTEHLDENENILTGKAIFNKKEYDVSIDKTKEDSYEMQAAIQIIKNTY